VKGKMTITIELKCTKCGQVLVKCNKGWKSIMMFLPEGSTIGCNNCGTIHVLTDEKP